MSDVITEAARLSGQRIARARRDAARQAVERIDLGALPGGLLLLPAKLAALGHGTRRA